VAESLKTADLSRLAESLSGDVFTDDLTRHACATDASVYQETPVAVVFPRVDEDLKRVVDFARMMGSSVIPRTAGTSLAGQVVGKGIVVDFSRYMNRVLELDLEKRTVWVQPGLIRDELNRDLVAHGLFFAPETSTSNRAMIGGMFGNNSCGANSIVYGTTRENVLATRGFLADGSPATFGPMNDGQLHDLAARSSLSPADLICNTLIKWLDDPMTRNRIESGFPKPSVTRRNTGYAVDRLIECRPFSPNGPEFNVCRLLAGSEGTLFLSTAVHLQLQLLPGKQSALCLLHFRDLRSAMLATPIVMKHRPFNCELIDRLLLEGASKNPEQRRNLVHFIDQPAAVLIVEVRDNDAAVVQKRLEAICDDVRRENLAYAEPILSGAGATEVHAVRRAGVGVVNNLPGDAKPTTVIEDTAVAVEDLPEYVAAIDDLLKNKHHCECVFYGHAGAGELHLRPVLNLRDSAGLVRFQAIAVDVAGLVRQFRGSLSGEHGDGRLRGPFVESMIGPENYQLLKRIKNLFDPHNTLNPGKIIDSLPITTALRYQGTRPVQPETVQNFSNTGGLLGAAEMCNGVGECRKSHRAGGTMCPSYMATLDEIHTTRGRANILRQILSGQYPAAGKGRALLDHPDLARAMELCLSCKACKSECPSNVDVARMKSEFLQAWHDAHGIPLRTRLVAGLDTINRWTAWAAPVRNLVSRLPMAGSLLRSILGFHPARDLPEIHRTSLRKWFVNRTRGRAASAGDIGGGKTGVRLFCDEFTNWLDVPVGIAAVELLERLGYHVQIPEHVESGRAAISEGLLRKARVIVDRNVESLAKALDNCDFPIVGIEPSSILTLRDEYPDLASPPFRSRAKSIVDRVLTIDEFFSRELDAGRIGPEPFSKERVNIRLHGHCHQTALSSIRDTMRMLQIPANYTVSRIPSGCCGMAGSFGYEKEHYELSMKIGELVLFPAVRSEPESTLIAAAGTSCRHQILAGTGRIALHPVQILRNALVQ
jgi:FAD/FMN-containing dehydrogenase/Fe-S oxidoreductase